MGRISRRTLARQASGGAQEGGGSPVYSQLTAAAMVCATAVVILSFVVQRYLVGGLTAGGVK